MSTADDSQEFDYEVRVDMGEGFGSTPSVVIRLNPKSVDAEYNPEHQGLTKWQTAQDFIDAVKKLEAAA